MSNEQYTGGFVSPAVAVQPNPIGAPSQNGEARRKRRRFRSRLQLVLAVLLALALGLLGGYVLGSIFGSTLWPQRVNPTVVTEDTLDDIVGTYTYDGKVYGITARMAFEDAGNLDGMRNDDGTYDAPTADMIFAAARNGILVALADGAGVTVDNAEVDAYALANYGTSDMSWISQYLGIDESRAWGLLSDATRVSKLREHVVGSGDAPAPPDYPEDGNAEVATNAYGSYIIGLLGGHWDGQNGTWADTDNEFYPVLSGLVFSADSANYEAAQAAYAIASSEYIAWSGDAAARWEEYVNQYFSKAAVTIGTLAV